MEVRWAWGGAGEPSRLQLSVSRFLGAAPMAANGAGAVIPSIRLGTQVPPDDVAL